MTKSLLLQLLLGWPSSYCNLGDKSVIIDEMKPAASDADARTQADRPLAPSPAGARSSEHACLLHTVHRIHDGRAESVVVARLTAAED